ncbi:hypothetical protein HDV03_002759 [Kappamyces sp. JEL0829]|nr:hypothetical protein HDV03_002759 [Kappamyces sp. JEL0829]
MWPLFLCLSLVASQTCISLENTKNCPEFKGIRAQLTLAFSVLSIGTSITNLATFDDYVQRQLGYNAAGSCALTTAPIRYAQSFICAFAVHFSTNVGSNGKKCNNNANVPKICKSVAANTLSDVSAAFKDSRFKCPANTQVPGVYTTYFNSLADTDCLAAVGDDKQRQCGFANPADATAFCSKSASDACCKVSAAAPVASSSALAASGASSSITSSVAALSTTAASLVPTSSATASDSTQTTSSSGGISPFIIGAGALGGVLVIVLASVLIFTKSNKATKRVGEIERGSPSPVAGPKSPSKPGPSPVAFGPPQDMECVYEYKARLMDEVELCKAGSSHALDVGDRVQVEQEYDDGWAFGRLPVVTLGVNLETGDRGIFPMGCVVPLGQTSEYDRDSRFDSERYSKRVSSMFPTDYRY